MSLEMYNLANYIDPSTIIQSIQQEAAELCASLRQDNEFVHPVIRGMRLIYDQPHIDETIIELESIKAVAAARIDRWRTRERLFALFLRSLPNADRVALIAEPSNIPEQLNEIAQNEANEIEVYLAYHYGYEPPAERVQITADPLQNLATLAGLFEE